MNWYGSGFLLLLNYGDYAEGAIEQNVLITENNFDLLTEDGNQILIES